MRLDLRRPLPFASDQFDAIYSSHTFEHLYRDQALALASECCRVLKSNGICRVVVPDLEAAIVRYSSRKEERTETAADNLMDELLLQPRGQTRSLLSVYHRLMNVHQHKWMYDGASLAAPHDLGLATEPTISENRSICLTNKIFTYLLAGVPVALSRTAAQAQLFRELGEAALLINLDNPIATATSFDSFFSSKDRQVGARRAAWALGQEKFNWDLEKEKFLVSMASCLGS